MNYNEKDEDGIVDEIADKILLKVGKGLKVEKVVASKIWSEIDISKPNQLITKEEKIVGFFKALLANDNVALKALSEGVSADGGYLVPDEFAKELIRDLEEPTRMRSMVRVVPMKRDVMKIPKLGSRPQVTWTAENVAKSTTTAGFDIKTLTAHKVSAILYASEELVEDSPFDLVELIIKLFSERIAEEEDKVITQGTGTGQPTGLTNCTISPVTCSGNLDFDDIINLIYALPSKYRVNAKFLVHNTNIKELRKIKDLQNRYIWQEAVAIGQPATIYGYPVYENNWLPESEIYFGNFKLGYWLGDRRRMALTVSAIAGEAWEKDQIGIRVSHRIAGNCVLENAMRKLITIP